jgi:hypothetical protein
MNDGETKAICMALAAIRGELPEVCFVRTAMKLSGERDPHD